MRWNKLGKGWDDVAMELGDCGGASPTNGVGDTRFFDTGDGSEAGFAEAASRDNGEAIKDPFPFAVARGAQPLLRGRKEFTVADGADALAAGIQEVGLVLLVEERLGRQLDPFRNGTPPTAANPLDLSESLRSRHAYLHPIPLADGPYQHDTLHKTRLPNPLVLL